MSGFGLGRNPRSQQLQGKRLQWRLFRTRLSLCLVVHTTRGLRRASGNRIPLA